MSVMDTVDIAISIHVVIDTVDIAHISIHVVKDTVKNLPISIYVAMDTGYCPFQPCCHGHGMDSAHLNSCCQRNGRYYHFNSCCQHTVDIDHYTGHFGPFQFMLSWTR
jgi:hypothetical protein